jgi:hypothetical protein
LNSRLPSVVDHVERPVLHIPFEFIVIHLTTNQTFGVEDSVLGVGMEGILGRVSNAGKILSQAKGRMKKRTYSRSSSVKPTHEGVIR